MSRSVLFYIIGLVIFQLSTCEEKPFTHKLMISGENIDRWLIEEINLPRDKNGHEPEEQIDSVRQIAYAVYDSMPQGDYLITIQSIFDDIKTIGFHLDKDTTISLHDLPGYDVVDSIPISQLLRSDTIIISHTVRGCFVWTHDVHYLVRHGNAFTSSATLSPENDLGKKIPTSQVIATITKLQQELQTGVDYSTTRSAFYIKTGNTVYRCDFMDEEQRGKFESIMETF